MNSIKRIYVLCLILLLAMCSSVYAAEEAQPLPFVKGESGLDSEEQMGDKISVYYSTISLLGSCLRKLSIQKTIRPSKEKCSVTSRLFL